MESPKQYHVPTRPYSPIDAYNRMCAALGSPRYAAAASCADYNGHHVRVWWNDHNGYYIAEYFWAGRIVLSRGPFEHVLMAAIDEHNRGALGSSVAIYPREDDADAIAMCEAMAAAPEAERVVWGGKEPERAAWMTWQHDVGRESARDSANPSRYVMVFDWKLMQQCETRAQYEAALKERHGSVWGF